jgi:uncharacterized protein YndB with AHSA1/START domain
MTFTNEILIARPTEVVFAYLAQLENIPQWNYAIGETRRQSGGEVGIGTVYLQRRTLPHPMQEELEITAFAPPRRLAFTGGFGPFHGTATYILAPTGTSTLLTNEVALEAAGAQRLLGSLASRSIKNAVAVNLDVLRSLLEQDHGRDSTTTRVL